MTPPEMEAELLTPVTKAWCTDLGLEVTSTAIQVFGGMGYIEESGVSQHFRDARIAPIYEGTNGIQAMDLVGRKLPMRMGGVVNDHFQQMRDLDAELAAAGDDFASIRSNLAGATPYLTMFGTVTGGWLMARQALAARAELEGGSDDTAYLGAKITTARFYCEQLLPAAAGLAPSVTAGSSVLYEVDGESLASV